MKIKKIISIACLLLFALTFLSGCEFNGQVDETRETGITVSVTEVGAAAIFTPYITISESPYAYEVKFFDKEGQSLDTLQNPQKVYLPQEELYNIDMILAEVTDTKTGEKIPSRYLNEHFMLEITTDHAGVFTVSAPQIKEYNDKSFESAKLLNIFANLGLIKQDDKGSFGGKAVVTRGEFAEMIKDTFNLTDYSVKSPKTKLTREYAAVMLVNASKEVLGYSLEGYESENFNPKDKKDISKDALSASSVMFDNNILKLKLEKFGPKVEVTTELACDMLYRFYNIPVKNSNTYPIEKGGQAVAFEGAEGNGVISYPSVVDAEKSSSFTLKANGVEVFVEKFYEESVARFEVSGETEIEIEACDIVKGALVSPRSLGIVAQTTDNKVKFTIDSSQKLMVQFGNLERLIILAEQHETDRPDINSDDVINVSDLGVDKTGKTMCTEILQKALDDASKEGKTVYFPNGKYNTGMLFIKSNTDVYLEPSAVLYAGGDVGQYQIEDQQTTSVVTIRDAQNVRLFGRGMIDGFGSGKRLPKWDNGTEICIHNLLTWDSRNIEIDGILSRDPTFWHMRILQSQDVAIKNTKVISNINFVMNDGIDPDWSKNITIENCLTYTNDDGICIKQQGGYRDAAYDVVSNIYAKNNIIFTLASALVMGTSTNGKEMHDIYFENNDIISADRGLSTRNYDYAFIYNVNYINNRIERIYTDAQRNDGLTVWLEFDNRDDRDRNRPEAANARMYDILVKDLRVLTMSRNPAGMRGENDTKTVSRINFENLVIGGLQVSDIKSARINANEFVNGIMFE